MIRKILVPVRGDGKGDNVLAHAAALARRHHSHVVVAHCRARPEDLMPYGVPIPAFLKKQIIEHAASSADSEEAGMREELRVLAKDLGLEEADAPVDGKASTRFLEEQGRQVDIIKRYGRLTDLIAVAKPDRDRNIGVNSLKAALFNTARPVLMCPPRDAAPDALGEHIAIAWNGSLEASRAVSQTLDLLAQATTVSILTGGGSEPKGATARDLAEYLAFRDIEAGIIRFDGEGNVGNKLLAEAASAGADILVMGAYGESHEKESIFGGNTQSVVDNATMPVVLVH